MPVYTYKSTMPSLATIVAGISVPSDGSLTFSNDNLTLNKFVPAYLDRFVDGVKSNSNLVTDLDDNFSANAAYQYGIDTSTAEYYGVSYNATAAENVANMNKALQTSRVITINTPGQYLFGGPGQGSILLPSFGSIIAGAGVELILADGTAEPLIRSANSWHTTPITVPAAITYATETSSLIGTANATGIGTKHPAGTWVAIAGLDPTNNNNRAFMGVFKVRSATADQIKFHMATYPAGGGNSTTGAKVYPADTQMSIIGGIWDGNDLGQGSPGYPAGDPREHTIHFRNSQDIFVSNVQLRRGMSWSIGTNNIRDAIFERITGDLLTDGLGAADVLFQGSGGGRNVILRNVTGQAKDNLVAWSLDTVGTQTYVNHDAGNTYNIKFENITLQGNNACGVALWGNTNYRHHSFVIDGVSGHTNTEGMVKVDCGYANTAMLNTRGGKLTIKNVEGDCQGALVSVRSDGDWDHIEVDGVRNIRSNVWAAAPLVTFTRLTTTQVINKVELKNLQHVIAGTTLNKSGASVIITDTTINELVIDGMPTQRLGANVSLIAHTGTAGIIGNMYVSNVHATANASGDSFLVSCENTSASTCLTKLTVRDSTFTALDATGGIVRQAPSVKVLRVRSDNNTVLGGTGQVDAAAISSIVRDGTGMTIDVVSATNTVAN
jgi:hypothetical protein